LELFKYLPPERIDVLENIKIRFTQAYALNDPFESFPAIVQKDRAWYKRQFLKRIENEANQYAFRNKVKRKQYIRARKKEFENFYQCYTDEKWLFEQAQSVIRLDSVVQGYLSLSATNKSILMWSHYAQNHEGFVIGFRREHEYFNYGLMKVKYKDKRPFLDPTQPKQDASLFYTKSTDWKYEEEYRKSIGFVTPIELENGNTLLPFPEEPPDVGDESLHAIRLFDFPKDCVSSIIVGWKSSPKLLSEIEKNLKRHQLESVAIYSATPHKFRYEMEVHEI
jgi:hypothetical protein